MGEQVAFLEVRDLHKRYQHAPLLDGVSFSVERGEIACLLGASGSGKTTLLRIIAGLEPARSGDVRVAGARLAGVPAHRRGIVLMFQEYALFPHMTVGENIAFGLRTRAWSPQPSPRDTSAMLSKRVDEMLSLVGLAGFGNRDVNLLSGGERQRVALARSLAPRPRLLLLDEPLGALDRNLRERLLEELPVILKEVGVTTLTVTHDQDEAFALADRVILLNEGRIVQEGAPEAVYNAPAALWVARFLGLQNLVPAVAVADHIVQTTFGVFDLCLLARDQAGLSPCFHGGGISPRKGASGTLLIHPWGIRFATQPESLASMDSLPLAARVVRCIFRGATYDLDIDLSGEVLHFTVMPHFPLPEVGDEIWVTFDPQALCWLDT